MNTQTTPAQTIENNGIKYNAFNGSGIQLPYAVWCVTPESAKKTLKTLKGISKGSWEYANVVYPLRKAVKANQDATLLTEGMGTTAQLARIFHNAVGYTY